MRPWLVVIGLLLLTLAAGLAASLYFAAQGNPTTSTTDTGPTTFLIAPNETQTLLIFGFNGTSEQLNLSWSSTGAIQFVLQSPAGCSGSCWTTSTLATWPSNSSGNWKGSGPFHYPLLCQLKNLGLRSASASVHARTTATSATHPSLGFEVILGAGAAALFAVGGVAVFLGLFLRGNPYGPPRPLAPRSAEDVEELMRNDRPGH
ncbi:MAG: hypothetical protein L3K14_09475 [Thermoplasmata archaeon]|nr:hypothetical protein [Thermoplasmata archaeon]